MSDQQNCPHCGAKGKEMQNIFRHEIRYACGSMGDLKPVFRFFPSDYCYERQLAAKDAEIERLKQALNSLLEVEELVCRFDHNGNCQSHYLDPAINGCRVAKARKLL